MPRGSSSRPFPSQFATFLIASDPSTEEERGTRERNETKPKAKKKRKERKNVGAEGGARVRRAGAGYGGRERDRTVVGRDRRLPRVAAEAILRPVRSLLPRCPRRPGKLHNNYGYYYFFN